MDWLISAEEGVAAFAAVRPDLEEGRLVRDVAARGGISPEGASLLASASLAVRPLAVLLLEEVGVLAALLVVAGRFALFAEPPLLSSATALVSSFLFAVLARAEREDGVFVDVVFSFTDVALSEPVFAPADEPEPFMSVIYSSKNKKCCLIK